MAAMPASFWGVVLLTFLLFFLDGVYTSGGWQSEGGGRNRSQAPSRYQGGSPSHREPFRCRPTRPPRPHAPPPDPQAARHRPAPGAVSTQPRRPRSPSAPASRPWARREHLSLDVPQLNRTSRPLALAAGQRGAAPPRRLDACYVLCHVLCRAPGRAPRGQTPRARGPQAPNQRGHQPRDLNPHGLGLLGPNPRGPKPRSVVPRRPVPRRPVPRSPVPRRSAPGGPAPRGQVPRAPAPRSPTARGPEPRGPSSRSVATRSAMRSTTSRSTVFQLHLCTQLSLLGAALGIAFEQLLFLTILLLLKEYCRSFIEELLAN